MGHSKAFHPSYDERDKHIMSIHDPIEAIEVIMNTYGDEIKRLIFTYLKNGADTDDVTQEVFVTVYQKLHMFQGKSTLRSWIYAIAINKCKDYLRSWHYRNQRLKEKLSIVGEESRTKNMETPEQVTIQQDEQSKLFEQVMDLPVKYREVIILFYFKELATKEISQILELNDATVRTRLNRGREKLKALLSMNRGESNE
ncbi:MULTISPECIES: sigma-70 family RNA polymerase sigma factor [unclassified Virgibacillus]|uniref:sigma-70 family RNA polymerase sigma factor n=1 Tax=unclassified Virgibacillus TaxID=2620237 RepID=UPI0024DE36BC|nr:sigma-70 family RNA polymerase sigma factor [Virgibacillus sp. LDC-1]